MDYNFISGWEYPYVQAWGMMMGSKLQDIAAEAMKAKKERAPRDAVYKSAGGDQQWRTVEDITSEDTKKRVRQIAHSMQYRYMYDRVIASGDHHGREDRTKALAQLIYAMKYDDVENKDAAVCVALETYEEMTGRSWDPTQAEYGNILYSIIG